MSKAAPDKLAFDTRLLDVHLTGLQAEVEAKLRRVRRFREQLQRIDAAAARRDTVVSDRAARALIQQVDEMLETNLTVRETLQELQRAARALLRDLREPG
jgi:hypothetical protein